MKIKQILIIISLSLLAGCKTLDSVKDSFGFQFGVKDGKLTFGTEFDGNKVYEGLKTDWKAVGDKLPGLKPEDDAE